MTKAVIAAGVAAIRAEAEAAGCTCEVRDGRKHLAVIVTAPDGRWHKLPVAGSPGADLKQVEKLKQKDVQRVLRSWGLIR